MVRKKVKLAFMENNTKRRVSYRKRQEGFLTKACELNTLCDVELATLVNSPYHNEPKFFPNHEDATGIFTKFIDLPEEKKSKNMKTQEKITMKRNEKIKNELEKPEDLNDLCYVINKNLKLINDRIKAKTHEEGSTSNAPQPIAGPTDSSGTSFDMSWAPLLAPVDTPVLSEIPLLVPSTLPSGTNFKRARAPLNLVPDVTPTSMVPLTAPLMALSSDHAQVPSLLSSQRYPEMAYSMAYPMSSPMLIPPMAPQINSSTNIPSMSASMPMENNVNGSFGIPQESFIF
ncbi:hypothetical protein H5410_004261 [Solanum commersonii]|uniref:MADS-box domain-containing protein n=1 Tax=Solanum commersonii TaxID=4109 RepID=A0A9J6B782_SOLCO|nr:hypothetical protein H5410_004261 [Solanum commersonii]